MPVQAVTVNGGTVTVCGVSCPGPYVRFYPPNAIPNAGNTGFRGYIWNVSANAVVPNTAYVLQFFVTGANKPCATPVAGSTTEVSCPVTAGLTYRITAYFKSGYTPGATNLLIGNWTP